MGGGSGVNVEDLVSPRGGRRLLHLGTKVNFLIMGRVLGGRGFDLLGRLFPAKNHQVKFFLLRRKENRPLRFRQKRNQTDPQKLFHIAQKRQRGRAVACLPRKKS